jgi:hypothetical protein
MPESFTKGQPSHNSKDKLLRFKATSPNLKNTGIRANIFLTSFPTTRRWQTTSPSSDPWSPSKSTTTPLIPL